MNGTERWLMVTLRAAPIVFFLWMIRDLLVPVALGALLALLLYPIERRMTRWAPRLKRISPLLLTAGTTTLVIIPLALVVVRVVIAIQSTLVKNTGDLLEWMARLEVDLSAALPERFNLSPAQLHEGLYSALQRLTSTLGGIATRAVASLPDQAINLFLFVLALYFSLRDGAALVRWTRRLSPLSDEETDHLYDSIGETVHGVILGQLAVSVVQGALTFLALYILRIPGAFVLGVVALIFSVVPVVGTAPVTLGATVYLAVVGRPIAAIGMGIAALIIGVSDNVVRPWVQSSSTHVHPLIVLLAIFGGIQVMGVAGIFLGPVIAAMAIWSVDLYSAIHHEAPKG